MSQACGRIGRRRRRTPAPPAPRGAATAVAARPRERRPPLTPRAGFRRSCAIVVSAGRDGCAHLHFPLPLEEPAAQRVVSEAKGPVRQRPTDTSVARRRGEQAERMARAPLGRASNFAMVASKLTSHARRPEAVRGRGHLRWHGGLPARVQVLAPERLSPESVQTAWFHAPAERHGPGRRQGTLRARSPIALVPARRPRRGRRRGLTALPPPGGPRTVLEPSSNRPRTFPEGPGQLPGRIPEGSRKDPARIRRGLGASGTPRSGRSAGFLRARPPTARLGALAGGAGLG